MTETYKTAIIRKRRGTDMRRRAVSGYAVRLMGFETRMFQTLKEAKAWIDSVTA
jgi:hypothetical protein